MKKGNYNFRLIPPIPRTPWNQPGRMKTNFENFRNLLNNTGSSFTIICLTETWCSNSQIISSSYFDKQLKAIPFERKTNKKGGPILIYVKTDLMYKIRKDLSNSDKDKEI